MVHDLVAAPDYLGTPAIGPDGTIYVRPNTSTKLFAFNPDGSSRWTVDTGLPGYGVPLTVGNDGTIYVVNELHLDAYRPDGTRKWDYVGSDGEPFAAATVGGDGAVYDTCDDIGLCSFSSSGTLTWQFAAQFQVWSASSTDGNGARLYFGSYDQNIYAVNHDGSIHWTFAAAGDIGYGVQAGPALASDGTVYVFADDEVLGSFLYAVAPGGSKKWQFQPPGRFFTPGLLDRDDTFYAVDSTDAVDSTEGTLYALSASGAVLFGTPIGPGAASAPSLGAGGTLYIGTRGPGGRLFALAP